MNDATSFQAMMNQLQARDDAAAAELFQRFGRRLIGLARTRLEKTVQRKVDPEDILQSVFKSFFVRQAGGQFELGDWDSLWSLLTMLTMRKCAEQGRYFRRGRRDVRREIGAPADPDQPEPILEALGREPTPEEAAVLADTVEQIMRGLAERERTILTLTLQGLNAREISEEAGYAERTVRRVLTDLRSHLKHLRDEEEPPVEPAPSS